MLRVFIIIALVFSLPLVTHALWYRLRGGSMDEYVQKAPLLVLSLAGALLVFGLLITFASFEGEPPGKPFRPPILKDGRIVPQD
ncbi:MAG: hypothetical protein R3D33_04490 [Hyphomicrobiaceae bacterium]